MGKVRTELVKRIARELIERYPDRFTANFESNKKLVESLITVSSTKQRNRIAGYVTRLLSSMQVSEVPEVSESETEEGS